MLISLLGVLLQTTALPLQAFDPRPDALATPPRPDAADAFFQSGEIPLIQIQIPPAGIEKLRRNGREDVKATVRDGDTEYADVAVHLKGAAGSYRGIDDQPALTLNFDKYREKQRFRGLDKLHLNNSVQDPSYLTEMICGDLFIDAGVPAARTTHAIVELNGRKLGLYVLKEGFNKILLKRFFKDPRGELFDGGFLRDIDQPLDRLSGEGELGEKAIQRLARACEISDRKERLAAMEQVLDVDRFLSFLAIEALTWHWDGYFMKRNNYRLYCEPTSGRLVFLPHGMDQMFWSPRGSIQPGAEGLAAISSLEIPELKSRYRARAAWISTNLFTAERIGSQIRKVSERIQARVQPLDPAHARELAGATRGLLRQVQARAEFVEQTLTRGGLKLLALKPGEESPLRDWKPRCDSGQASLIQTSEAGKPVLSIEVNQAESGPDGKLACLASFRKTILLAPGQYDFLGRIRTDGLEAVETSARGLGAGLRLAGQRRALGLTGNQDWQEVRCSFEITSDEAGEVELICDFRAVRGKASFDLDSLRLQRKASAQP